MKFTYTKLHCGYRKQKRPLFLKKNEGDVCIGDGLGGMCPPRSLAFGGLRHDESSDLDLTVAVEAEHADVAVRVGLLALLDFTENGCGVSAPEHGQFPHCPVAPIVVARSVEVVNVGRADLVELEARDPPLVDDVVHLLRDLLLG